MSKILVVEDEAVVAVHLAMILQGAGHETTDIVADGAAALEAAARDVPDLVLMDMTIQGALDGIETARLLRERFPALKLVFVTAHSDEASRARAAVAKPDGFLLKPFSDDQLGAAIANALAQGAQDPKLGSRR